MKQTHQSARMAMRFLRPHARDILTRMAKLAGVRRHTAFQHMLRQHATCGTRAFDVPSKDGCVATYHPRPSRW